MNQLSRDAFNQARDFLKTQARPLDQAIFEFRFEGAPAEGALTELARFQNDDGGFGNALEPDLRTPTSSALATGIGLHLLQEVGCPDDHPLVRAAVQFLLSTFNPQRQVWRVAPHDTNDFPHAPWWHDEDGSLAETFDDFLIIPRAQLVGLLHVYAAQVPANWLAEVTERTVADIEILDASAFRGGGDTLRYALDLAETAALPRRLAERLIPRLREITPAVVSRDPQEWDSYCAPPLKIAPTPECIVAGLFWDDLQAHLDYQIAHQTPEGTWEPTWTWGDFYAEAWERTKREWRGHLTLETLTTLQRFGRIEGGK